MREVHGSSLAGGTVLCQRPRYHFPRCLVLIQPKEASKHADCKLVERDLMH